MDISTLRKKGILSEKKMLGDRIVKDEGETLTYKVGNFMIACKWDERLFTTIVNNVPDITFLSCWCHVNKDNLKSYVIDLFIDEKHVRIFADFFPDELRFATNMGSRSEFKNVRFSYLPIVFSVLHDYVLEKMKIRQLVQPIPIRYMTFTKELKEQFS